jgi:hypothetical protein
MSKLTICPCCGEKFEGDLSAGCVACGALAVGPPLRRPERELPGYGHAFAACASGLLLLISLAVAFVAAMWERETLSFDPEALLRAAETAAWRLKLTALPASFAFLLLGTKLYARVRREPARHAGHGFTRAGLALTVAVSLALVMLIGITIPERLRMRELARRAADNAQLYAVDIALARYRQRFGTYPAALEDLRRLEDADGSIARVLDAASAGEYKPESDIASLSTGRAKARNRRRGSALRGHAGADDLPDTGIVLTDYELALPGRDKVLGTNDDLHIRNGVISDAPHHAAKSAATPTVADRRAH